MENDYLKIENKQLILEVSIDNYLHILYKADLEEYFFEWWELKEEMKLWITRYINTSELSTILQQFSATG